MRWWTAGITPLRYTKVIVYALYEVPKPFCFKYVFGLMDRQTKAMA